MISAILLSGGVGSRSGKNVPKQYIDLMGKKIICYCLDSLVEAEVTEELVVVYGDGYKELLTQILSPYKSSFKEIKLVPGGDTRQRSVYNGLKECSCDSVIIHESARPLITGDDILEIVNHPSESVTMGEDIPFTVLKKHNGMIVEILNRHELFNVQLPQKFNRVKLLNAHSQAFTDKREFTDDSSLIFAYNGQVAVIKGSPENIKITNPKDFSVAEEIIKSRLIRRES